MILNLHYIDFFFFLNRWLNNVFKQLTSARYLGDDFLTHMTFAYVHIPTSE